MPETPDTTTIGRKYPVKLTTISKDDLKKVIAGIDQLADIMEVTLGAYGRNVLIQKKNKAFSTKDGFTVAQFATTGDVYKNLGMAMLREISMAMNFEVGDGTTTAALLGREIIKAGYARIEAGENPVRVARAIAAEAEQIIEKIGTLSRPVASPDEIQHVATVSSGYEKVGQLIGDIYREQGNDASITVERSTTEATTVEHVKGLKVNATYVAPQFINADNQRCIIKDAAVLILNREHIVSQEVMDAVTALYKTRGVKNLVIFCRHITDDIVGFLLQNREKGALNPVLLPIPSNIDDIELITGARPIAEDSTRYLNNFQTAWAGYTPKIICGNKYSTLFAADNRKGDIDDEIERLKDLDAKKEITSQDRARLANLQGMISVLKLGKMTELGYEEMQYRVEDAVRAVEMAVKHGIIEGEFQGLLKAVKGSAFYEPIVQKLIAKLFHNSGITDQITVSMAQAGGGYNFAREEFSEDLVADGIIDPVEVTRKSLKNAVNIASIFLTLDGLVIDALVDEKP